jgi:4'-phosphopantetheinyl transferase
MTCAGTIWRQPGNNYALPPNEVHVWRATLHQPQEAIAVGMRILSVDERARAEKFHFEADKRRHIIGRGMARTLIGHCLHRPPDGLKFAYNGFGKPSLAPDTGPSIEFNISHSGELVLVALAYGRTLGVDVESMQREMATGEIATRFFSPNECRVLSSLPADAQCAAFFACWTRKEAYLKARGDGLSLPLDQFDVAFLPGEKPRLLETRHDPAEAGRWTMCALEPGHGCAAALAVEGSQWKLACWDWPLLPG